MITLTLSSELHADDIGASIGLAHGECTDLCTRAEIGQILFFLAFRAVALELVNTQVGVRAVGQTN